MVKTQDAHTCRKLEKVSYFRSQFHDGASSIRPKEQSLSYLAPMVLALMFVTQYSGTATIVSTKTQGRNANPFAVDQ
jgi:hypothetical protein